MSRHFAPITCDELKQKFTDKFGSTNKFLYGDSKANDDISKVQFDCENWEDQALGNNLDKIMGLHTLPSGLTFWGMYAGGDWEAPVFFIVYWDGKEIRGYIPTKGNTWNTKTKEAFGNDYDNEDAEDAPELDPDQLLADIEERIVPPKSNKKDKAKSGPKTLADYSDLELFDELKRRGIKQW